MQQAAPPLSISVRAALVSNAYAPYLLPPLIHVSFIDADVMQLSLSIRLLE
jgi:hypothetical protein